MRARTRGINAGTRSRQGAGNGLWDPTGWALGWGCASGRPLLLGFCVLVNCTLAPSEAVHQPDSGWGCPGVEEPQQDPMQVSWHARQQDWNHSQALCTSHDGHSTEPCDITRGCRCSGRRAAGKKGVAAGDGPCLQLWRLPRSLLAFTWLRAIPCAVPFHFAGVAPSSQQPPRQVRTGLPQPRCPAQGQDGHRGRVAGNARSLGRNSTRTQRRFVSYFIEFHLY